MLSSKTLGTFVLGLGLCALACGQDSSSGVHADEPSMDTDTGTGNADEIGDDDVDGDGDGDGDPAGDGDGDGDGDGNGDGDGDPAGDGDGDGDAGPDNGDGDGDAQQLCAGPCGTLGCGECPDAPMIDADWFFIDATEVTVGDYADFAALEFHPIVVEPACAWKLQVDSFVPDDWDQQLAGDFQNPVRGVDWCDAAVYCEWAGKRLCGVIGGGPALLHELADDANEWHRACTAGGVSKYPYGNGYQKLACNGADQGVADVVPVGLLEDCEGGVEGLFDMSGNLWEWTNACADDPGAEPWEQDCQRRGGSFHSSKEVLRCSVDSRRHRGYRDTSTGIRCCAD